MILSPLFFKVESLSPKPNPETNHSTVVVLDLGLHGGPLKGSKEPLHPQHLPSAAIFERSITVSNNLPPVALTVNPKP